jgi:hypothetical protein
VERPLREPGHVALEGRAHLLMHRPVFFLFLHSVCEHFV